MREALTILIGVPLLMLASMYLGVCIGKLLAAIRRRYRRARDDQP